MDGLSFSSWVILVLGFIICFGGAFYCLLIIWGKNPNRLFEMLGIARFMESSSESLVDMGIWKPFEYMEKGPKEKGVSLAVMLLLLTIGWGLGAFDVESEGLYRNPDDPNFDLVNGSWSADDYTDEGQSTDVESHFSQRVNETTFTLRWTDDDTTEGNVGGMGVQNQPDKFNLTVISPNGTEYSDEAESDISSEDGEITIHIEIGLSMEEAEDEQIDDFEAGDWVITVECVEAGDSETTTGQTMAQDGGNEWTLDVSYTHYKEKTGGGGILD